MRRHAWVPVALLAVMLSPVSVSAQQAAGAGFAVVELFTSEGCSSCPPADEALSQLIRWGQRENLPIYALEWHVDYWDSLGWKDPWDSHFATDRQYAYARSLPSSVYTPQAVINGQIVASYAGDLLELENVARYAVMRRPQSAVSLTEVRQESPGAIRVHIEVSGAPSGANVLVAEVEGGLTATPNAGENAGRTLAHSNVVRALKVLPASSGDAVLDVPRSPTGKSPALIALLEDTRTGHILAATQAGLSAAGEKELSGRVVDDKDKAVAGVMIQACGASLCIPASTDDQGYFTLRGVPPGSYELALALPASANAHVRFFDHPAGITVSRLVWQPEAAK